MKKSIVIGVVLVVAVIAVISFALGTKFAREEDAMKTTGDSAKMERENADTQMITDDNSIKYRTVKLFYYNSNKDNCNIYEKGLESVEREVPDSDNITDIIKNTFSLWLEGEITAEEKDSGLSVELPAESGVKLADAALDRNGILTLTFSDPNYQTGGGSCHTGIIVAEIDAIAKQFPEVKSINLLPKDRFDA